MDDRFQPLLRPPRRPGIGIEIGDMMARLVAVDILADEPGDILGMAVIELRVVVIEHRVELGDRFGVAAEDAKERGLILRHEPRILPGIAFGIVRAIVDRGRVERGAETAVGLRSEEHTSELQSLMRISYAVFCLKKKKTTTK